MPYFLIPDQGYQYFDTEDEYNKQLTDKGLTSPYKPQAQPEVSAEQQPEEQPQPEQEVKGPDWWENTVEFAKEALRVPVSMGVQVLEDATEGFQQQVQTTPTSQAQIGMAAAFGGDPTAAYMGQLLARQQAAPESLETVETRKGKAPRFVAEELEETDVGAQYAALGLQLPTEEGIVKPLGMGSDTPIVGPLAKGGAIYEATNPKTELGRGVSDVGTIILQSMLFPNATGVSSASVKIRGAETAIKRAALRPNAANLRQAGVVVAKRLGLDLPQDAVEELLLGSTVRLDAAAEAQVGKALDQISTEDKDDLLKELLATTDAEEDYYAKRAQTFLGGMLGTAVFRGSLSLVKNALKRRAIRELSSSKTLSRQEAATLKEKQIKLEAEEQKVLAEVEAEAADRNQRAVIETVSNTTRNYNHEYEQSLTKLNENASGLMRAQDAILGTSQEAIGFGRRSIELGAEADVDIKEIDRLTKLDKARQSAIREMDRAAKADPNYLKKPSNKTRYNRYKKQQAEYETRIKELEESTFGRLEEVESIEQREMMSGEQMDSMLAAQRMGRETFQNNINTFIERINKLEEEFDVNNQQVPAEARGDLNYRASVSRLRQAVKRYQELLPKAVEGVEDPTIDLAKIKNERQLLETIQELFNELPNASSINKVELQPEVVQEAVKRLQAETAPKAEAAEEPVKTVEAEVVEDPWKTSQQVPLRQLADTNEAEIRPGENPNIKTGFTEQPAVTKEVEARRAETELYGEEPVDIEGMARDVSKATEQEAVDEFWANNAQEYGRNDTGWGARADRSLIRTVNGTSNSAERMMKLLSDKKFEKMPQSALPDALRAMGPYMDALSNAENQGFGFLADFLQKRALKSQKLLKALPEAIKYSFATGLNIGVTADRLYTASKKTQQFLEAGMSDGRTYRLHVAQQAKEALMLYQALGDFMAYRNHAGTYLASFKGKYRMYLAQQLKKVRGKRVTTADLENDLEKFAAATNEQFVKTIADMQDGLDEYIGLPSNLQHVEEILAKASDPDQVLDASEEAVFKELTNNLIFASANPHLLGSKPLEGDGILVRTLRSGGLTSLSTQFIQPVQAGVTSAGDFTQKLIAGPSMQLSNFVRTTLGGKADKEAQLEASRQTRLAGKMFHTFLGTIGAAADNARTMRMFGRSTVNDAVTTSKFGRQMMSDPLREAQMIKDLNSKEPENNTIYKALIKAFGEEEGQRKYNYLKVDAKNFNDLFFLGSADQALRADGNLTAGAASSFFNKASLQGLGQVGLQKLNEVTKGGSFLSPYKSKYTGGEKVGGNIGFAGAEWATEYVSSIYAQVYAKAAAMDDVAAMTTEEGVAKYVQGSPAFDLAVQKQFLTHYTEPVFAGIGDDMQEIGYAIKNQEAIDLAKYTDMQEEFVEGTIKGDIGRAFTAFGAGNYKLFSAIISPYVKAPLNAVARFVYYQPTAGPVPLGAFAEAAESTWHHTGKKIAFAAKYKGPEAYKKWKRSERKILGFQSQLNHPDAFVRQRANSSLILATTVNTGLLALVMNNDVEITGGQKGTYRNALYAEIPAYHIKLGGQWMPYRYIPFVGELLSYSANMRDYIRSENISDSQHFFGAGVAATAMSILDNPAIQGLDTIISATKDPHKAETLLLQYIEKVTNGQLIGLRKFALTTIGPDVYKTKRIITGSRAGMLDTTPITEEALTPEEAEEMQKLQYMEKLNFAAAGVGDYLQKPLVFAAGIGSKFADTMGLTSIVEYLDEQVSPDEVTEGDYRVAHWYKPEDVTYPGVRERTFFSSVAGKVVPFPAQADTVDNELFLNGVRPPEQVFRKFGILANEVALNRFRRFLGSEYRHQTFDENGNPVEYSMYEMFDRLISGKQTVDDTTYDKLPDDYKVALNLNAIQRPPVFSNIDSLTKREALENLKQEMIAQARVEFLSGTRSVQMTDGSIDEVPAKFAAPADMQEEYQNYLIKLQERS
jgi:hypothetical protein